MDQHPDGRWPAAQSAGGRRDCRRGRSAGVFTADSDFVFLHSGAGGLGLSAACSIFARHLDGQGGAVRARLHSAAVKLCLRSTRHHGHPHHCQLAGPPGHHHGGPAHDLLGPPAGVCPADWGLCARSQYWRVQPARVDPVCTVRGGRGVGHGGGLGIQTHLDEKPLPAPDAGVAALPRAGSAQPGTGVVGARTDIFAPSGHHHLCHHGRAVVLVDLPRPTRWCNGLGHSIQHRRNAGPLSGAPVCTDWLQLANLYRTGARNGSARGGGGRAGHGVCLVGSGRLCGQLTGTCHCPKLVAGNCVFVAGLVCFCTAVHLHPGRGPA